MRLVDRIETPSQDIFKEKIEDLENDPKLQDAILSIHHSMMISLGATPAAKIIENQNGRAFIMQAQMLIPIARP